MKSSLYAYIIEQLASATTKQDLYVIHIDIEELIAHNKSSEIFYELRYLWKDAYERIASHKDN